MTDCVTPADSIAGAALVVALLAMGATFWQAAIARRHNRLSVRPVLSKSQRRSFGPQGLTLGLALVNMGAGPAVIRDCYFEQNGDRLVLPKGEEHPVRAVLHAAIGTKVQYSISRFGLPALGSGIAPQTEFFVFEAHFPTIKERTASVLDDLARGFCLVVVYESLYEERHSLRVSVE